MFSPDFVPVTSRLDWFAPPQQIAIAHGSTLAQILDACGVPEDLQPYFDVAINGEIIAPQFRRLVRPKTGTRSQPVVVTVHPPSLHGGKKSTGKNVLTIVATIALIAGTAFIGAGGLVALGASATLFGAGTVGASLAAAGLGIAGQIAIQALAPPPLAGNRQQNFKPDVLAGITANPVQPFEYLAKAYGRVKASPPLVARPFSLLENGVVTAYAIFGLAGNTLIEDVCINGVKISEFPEVEYETRDGSASVTDLTLVTQCGFEQPGEALSEYDLEERGGDLEKLVNQSEPTKSLPQYHYFQTTGAADEAHIRLAFPAGLFSSSGNRTATAFRIEFKRRGSSTWIKGPEIFVSPASEDQKAFRQRIRLVWEAMTGSSIASNSSTKTFYAYGYTGSASYNWAADGYFRLSGTNKPAKNVQIDDDGISIFLSGSQWPKDVYDIRLKRSLMFQFGEFNQSAYAYDGNDARANFFDYALDGSVKYARIRQNKWTGPVQVEAVTTIKKVHPIADKSDLALIAVKAKRVQIDSVSATFTSRARISDGVNWETTFSPTDNPAALYREVLLGSLNARPLSAGMVDDEALAKAYDDFEANGYKCNGILQGYSVEQVLQAIAACGRAVPRQEEKWSMLLERDTSAQACMQVLSPRVYRNLTIERSFDPLPHAIRAQFLNAENDYRADERLVYRTGFNASNATLFQAINYDLLTDAAAVESRAAFDMKQLLYRKNRYVCEVDWINLVSPRGSLIGLKIDELATASGSALISEVLRSGGNITGLVLDAAVTSPASDAGAIIQFADNTTVTRQIAPITDSKVITLSTPMADPGDDLIEPGKAVVVGEFSRVVKRCKVFLIERLSDMQARLTLLDEAPEIHA
jgi:hypothetical protein